MQAEKERVYNILKSSPQFDRKRHGSLWDRGSADSYYSRSPSPHWWPNGTGNGPVVTGKELTAAEREEYLAGYHHNEQYGDKKSYD